MLSVLKTAIVTITLSFISGVLLDRYKNISPRIVCSIGKGISLKIRGKKIRAYVLKVTNVSKHTIHNLNLNVQGGLANLNIDDAKITKGLKFDISKNTNSCDVTIPFLSKNDEFSIKVFLEDLEGKKSRPIIALRSPEDFKRIDSCEDDGFINSLKSIPRNIGECFSKPKNIGKGKSINKKVVISIGVIAILVVSSIFVSSYLKQNPSLKEKQDTVNVTTPQRSEEKSEINNKNNAAQDKSKNSSNTNSKQPSESLNSENSKQTNNTDKNTKTYKDKDVKIESKDNSKTEENDKKEESTDKTVTNKEKTSEESKDKASESTEKKDNKTNSKADSNTGSNKDSNAGKEPEATKGN